MQRNWSKSLRECIEKRPKKLDNKSQKKKKRSLVVNYQGRSQPSQYTDREGRSIKEKGKRDGKKIERNRKTPWNKEP